MALTLMKDVPYLLINTMPNFRNQAINAAFYADPVLLQQLIDEGNFPKSLIEDTGILNVPFPIWRIPQCWEIAMGNDPKIYRDEIQGEVADFMERNAKVKAIFTEAFAVEYSPIDYQQYHDYFFSKDPEESDVDIIMEDNWAEIYRYGTRDIDLKLFCATERFDFPMVKDLLEQGADPYAPAYSDASASTFTRIGDECSFLCTCELSWAWAPGQRHNVNVRNIGDLIGWAAHEEMYRWLEKYSLVKKDIFYEAEYVFQEEMHEKGAKVYPIAGDGEHRDVLVLDGSRAWFIELPSREMNLDNYKVCVSGYNKYFKALFGVETHQALVETFEKEYCRKDAMAVFLKRIQGKEEFKVCDYRLTDSSSDLDKFIDACADRRYKTNKEIFMYWYREVSKHLLTAGLPEANVIDLLRKHPIQVSYILAHGSGLTPEVLAKRFLEKPLNQKVYDEYAKPKVRVTAKMIAAFRKELEQEYRKIQTPDSIITEEYIQEQCYGVSDDYIRDALKSRQSAADVVFWETY